MSFMKKKLGVFALLCGSIIATANAHDLFLKFNNYFLNPNSNVTVRLLNGTFHSSENPVARERMVDVSLVNPAGERTHPLNTNWRDEGTTALLDLQTGAAGNYVIGLYTKPRELNLKAAAFNDYLAHDGVPDILAARKRDGELKKDIRERYSKHVKAIFQAGDNQTDNCKTALGYPVEIIPQQNPYTLQLGQSLDVLCVQDGKPLAGQVVLAGRDLNGKEFPAPRVRTDQQGIARIKLTGAGKWYIKFIHMMAINDGTLNYESKWATLTFQMR